MLRLSNGHEFVVACASGALAYGSGYWWEKFGFIPLGIIDPKLFTIITKTVTYRPKTGNYLWYRFWTCIHIQFWKNQVVNAFGLTNPGFDWLEDQYYGKHLPVNGMPTIVSIMAEDVAEATEMAYRLNQWKSIKGIEVNVSCPNVEHKPLTKEEKVNHIVDIYNSFKNHTTHPVGLKLGYLDPYLDVCKRLDGVADWFDLINTVPWDHVYPNVPSPLARYDRMGGVSGPAIKRHAREALFTVAGLKTPIVSGGGIMNTLEAFFRLKNGAAAVTLGTVFLTRFWRVNKIAKELRSLYRD